MSQEQPPFGLPGPVLAGIQRRPDPGSRIKFNDPPSVVMFLDLLCSLALHFSYVSPATHIRFLQPSFTSRSQHQNEASRRDPLAGGLDSI